MTADPELLEVLTKVLERGRHCDAISSDESSASFLQLEDDPRCEQRAGRRQSSNDSWDSWSDDVDDAPRKFAFENVASDAAECHTRPSALRQNQGGIDQRGMNMFAKMDARIVAAYLPKPPTAAPTSRTEAGGGYSLRASGGDVMANVDARITVVKSSNPPPKNVARNNTISTSIITRSPPRRGASKRQRSPNARRTFSSVDLHLARGGINTKAAKEMITAPIFRCGHKSSANHRDEPLNKDTSSRVSNFNKRIRWACKSQQNLDGFCTQGGNMCETSEVVDADLDVQALVPRCDKRVALLTPDRSQPRNEAPHAEQCPTAPVIEVKTPLNIPKPRATCLSEEQIDAVNAPFERPLLVLAGPGSGKTLFLASRIARALTDVSGPPCKVAAVTYTRMAATEIEQRVKFLTGVANGSGLWVGTVHGLALRLLRETRGGRPLKIASTEDSRDALQALLVKLPQLWSAISNSTNHVDDDETEEDFDDDNVPTPGRQTSKGRLDEMIKLFRSICQNPGRWRREVESKPELSEALAGYQEEMRQRGLLEMAWIIPAAINLIRAASETNRIQLQRWAAWHLGMLFVDEWQDTDSEQAQFLRHLCGVNGSKVTAVGDDDQRIYAWRNAGCDKGPACAFAELWPDANIRCLGLNFRSAVSIVAAAARLIAFNSRRINKALNSARSSTEGQVTVEVKQSENEELTWVCGEIKRLAQGRAWNNFAVLARTQVTCARLEDKLKKAGVPAERRRGRIMDRRREASNSGGFNPSELDFLTFLRLAINEHEDRAFLRIYNTPRRGLGKAAIKAVCNKYRGPRVPADFTGGKNKKWSPLEGLAALNPEEVGKAVAGGRPETIGGSFAGALKRFAATPWNVSQRIAQGLGSLELVLRAIRSAATEERTTEDMCHVIWAALKQGNPVNETLRAAYEKIVAAAAAHAASGQGENPKNGAAAVANFFRNGLCILADNGPAREVSDTVNVCTIHGAKGLEWDVVFVVQCSEANFYPKRNGSNDWEVAVEEERRLMYVAMTRACNHLVMTCSLKMHDGTVTVPSRFLYDAGLLQLPSTDEIQQGNQPHQQFVPSATPVANVAHQQFAPAATPTVNVPSIAVPLAATPCVNFPSITGPLAATTVVNAPGIAGPFAGPFAATPVVNVSSFAGPPAATPVVNAPSAAGNARPHQQLAAASMQFSNSQFTGCAGTGVPHWNPTNSTSHSTQWVPKRVPGPAQSFQGPEYTGFSGSYTQNGEQHNPIWRQYKADASFNRSAQEGPFQGASVKSRPTAEGDSREKVPFQTTMEQATCVAAAPMLPDARAALAAVARIELRAQELELELFGE